MHDQLAATAAGSAAATVAVSPLLHPHGDGHAVCRESGFAGHEVAAAPTTQRHAAALPQAYGPAAGALPLQAQLQPYAARSSAGSFFISTSAFLPPAQTLQHFSTQPEPAHIHLSSAIKCSTRVCLTHAHF